jgi:hypothetical protein
MAEGGPNAENGPPDEDPDQQPSPEEPGPPGDPSSDPPEITDPFERDTIKYAVEDEERILGVVLDGPKVGKRSIDVFTLGEFLAQLDRVIRALTAAAEGLALAPTGKIPRPPEAAPWRTRALAFEHSATLEFVLGGGEVMRMSHAGGPTSPTIEAVVALGRLVGLDVDQAVSELTAYDDRIGTDFSTLLGLLADNDLTSRWQPIRTQRVDVSVERADRVRTTLRTEVEPKTGLVTVTGFLFRLDAKRNDFKLEPDEGPAITGSYDDALIPDLRDSWSHRVVAELTSTEHRYPYASRPHKVVYALKRIVRKLGPVELDQ